MKLFCGRATDIFTGERVVDLLPVITRRRAVYQGRMRIADFYRWSVRWLGISIAAR